MARKTIRDYGKSLFLNGSSDFVSLGTFNPSSGNLSISFWYRGEFSGTRGIISKRDAWNDASGAMWQLALSESSGTVRFERWGGGVDTTVRLIPGEWHHFLLVHTYNDKIEVYQDGVLVATVAGFTYGTKPTSGMFIGQNGQSGEFFGGKIDEVCMWNTILTAAEVMALYLNQKLPTDIAGLQCYYKFDEASGATAIDSSGNGHDGIITGATRVSDVVMINRASV